MTDPDEWVTLRGWTPDGRAARWRVRLGAQRAAAGSRLVTRLAELPDGTRLLHRGLPGDPQVADRHVEQLLDNDARSLIRLDRSYDHGPRFFPTPVGYGFDTEEPFLLVTEDDGRTATDVVGTLLHDQRVRFTVSLLHAIAFTSAADLVHGALDLPALRFDGAVRISTWENAVLAGEVRRDGTTAHPGDDILAAARLLYRVYCGTPLTSLADLDGLPALRDPLRDMLATNPAHRPTADEVLRTMGFDPPPANPRSLDAGLQPGRERFDRLRTRKVPRRPSAPAADRKVGPTPRRRRWPWQGSGAVVLLLLATSMTLMAEVWR